MFMAPQLQRHMHYSLLKMFLCDWFKNFMFWFSRSAYLFVFSGGDLFKKKAVGCKNNIFNFNILLTILLLFSGYICSCTVLSQYIWKAKPKVEEQFSWGDVRHIISSGWQAQTANLIWDWEQPGKWTSWEKLKGWVFSILETWYLKSVLPGTSMLSLLVKIRQRLI